jgi:hypothetical protein
LIKYGAGGRRLRGNRKSPDWRLIPVTGTPGIASATTRKTDDLKREKGRVGNLKVHPVLPHIRVPGKSIHPLISPEFYMGRVKFSIVMYPNSSLFMLKRI